MSVGSTARDERRLGIRARTGQLTRWYQVCPSDHQRQHIPPRIGGSVLRCPLFDARGKPRATALSKLSVVELSVQPQQSFALRAMGGPLFLRHRFCTSDRRILAQYRLQHLGGGVGFGEIELRGAFCAQRAWLVCFVEHAVPPVAVVRMICRLAAGSRKEGAKTGACASEGRSRPPNLSCINCPNATARCRYRRFLSCTRCRRISDQRRIRS